MGCNFDLSDIDFHGYATKNKESAEPIKKDEVNKPDERLA